MKTAFPTKQGLFKYAVTPFDLTNALVSFQDIMDAIFQDMEVCIWYLEEIVIYGDNMEAEHLAIVEKVLLQSVEHGLGINPLNSRFHIHKTIFLNFLINSQEVEINFLKLETISNWPIST